VTAGRDETQRLEDDRQPVETFEATLQVQVGLVPVAKDDARAVQVIVQVNEVEVISEVLTLAELGLATNKLYYPRLTSNQLIDLSAAQWLDKFTEPFSALRLSNFNVHKAKPVYIEGTAAASSFWSSSQPSSLSVFSAQYYTQPWSHLPTSFPSSVLNPRLPENQNANHYVIYFKLFDACK
jgi:hypothetical protein